jgi:hypothetical protein
MIPKVPFRQAITDTKLLGNVLPRDSYRPIDIISTAAFGEALTDEERVIFQQFTGRDHEPDKRIDELIVVKGRRSGLSSTAGKSWIPYIAGLCTHPALVRGERGVVLCVAPDQAQATILLDYAHAAFEQSPILSQLIKNRTSDTLALTNNISIEVRSSNFRRLRGSTYAAVNCDESAFWMDSESGSSNPDTEILEAIRPGLATTGGPLFMISSPYARRGVLWETYDKHYGAKGDPLILVAQGTSRQFNPTLPQAVVDRALERDPAAASAEWLAQFRLTSNPSYRWKLCVPLSVPAFTKDRCSTASDTRVLLIRQVGAALIASHFLLVITCPAKSASWLTRSANIVPRSAQRQLLLNVPIR